MRKMRLICPGLVLLISVVGLVGAQTDAPLPLGTPTLLNLTANQPQATYSLELTEATDIALAVEYLSAPFAFSVEVTDTVGAVAAGITVNSNSPVDISLPPGAYEVRITAQPGETGRALLTFAVNIMPTDGTWQVSHGQVQNTCPDQLSAEGAWLPTDGGTVELTFSDPPTSLDFHRVVAPAEVESAPDIFQTSRDNGAYEVTPDLPGSPYRYVYSVDSEEAIQLDYTETLPDTDCELTLMVMLAYVPPPTTNTAEAETEGPDAVAQVPTTVAPAASPAAPGTPSDTDGDGVPNYIDNCPNEPGRETGFGQPDNGCPATAQAAAPALREAAPSEGAVVSLIEGGIIVLEAALTFDPELQSPDGIVLPVTTDDIDQDGIVDTDDACPSTPGVGELAGCPPIDGSDFQTLDYRTAADADNDGIPDLADACPNEEGIATNPSAQNHGCPEAGPEDAFLIGGRPPEPGTYIAYPIGINPANCNEWELDEIQYNGGGSLFFFLEVPEDAPHVILTIEGKDRLQFEPVSEPFGPHQYYWTNGRRMDRFNMDRYYQYFFQDDGLCTQVVSFEVVRVSDATTSGTLADQENPANLPPEGTYSTTVTNEGRGCGDSLVFSNRIRSEGGAFTLAHYSFHAVEVTFPIEGAYVLRGTQAGNVYRYDSREVDLILRYLDDGRQVRLERYNKDFGSCDETIFYDAELETVMAGGDSSSGDGGDGGSGSGGSSSPSDGEAPSGIVPEAGQWLAVNTLNGIGCEGQENWGPFGGIGNTSLVLTISPNQIVDTVGQNPVVYSPTSTADQWFASVAGTSLSFRFYLDFDSPTSGTYRLYRVSGADPTSQNCQGAFEYDITYQP